MGRIDYSIYEKYIEVRCNCHPETCGCGGSRTIINPNYRTETIDKKEKKIEETDGKEISGIRSK